MLKITGSSVHIKHEDKATLHLKDIILFWQIFNRKRKGEMKKNPNIERGIKAEMRIKIMKEEQIRSEMEGGEIRQEKWSENAVKAVKQIIRQDMCLPEGFIWHPLSQYLNTFHL